MATQIDHTLIALELRRSLSLLAAYDHELAQTIEMQSSARRASMRADAVSKWDEAIAIINAQMRALASCGDSDDDPINSADLET